MAIEPPRKEGYDSRWSCPLVGGPHRDSHVDGGMKVFLGLLLVYLVIHLGLIAIGVGFGFLLHGLMPSVDLGMGILTGVVSAGFSIHYFFRLLGFFGFLELPLDPDDDEFPPIRVYPLGPSRSAKRRKRKER